MRSSPICACLRRAKTRTAETRGWAILRVPTRRSFSYSGSSMKATTRSRRPLIRPWARSPISALNFRARKPSTRSLQKRKPQVASASGPCRCRSRSVTSVSSRIRTAIRSSAPSTRASTRRRARFGGRKPRRFENDGRPRRTFHPVVVRIRMFERLSVIEIASGVQAGLTSAVDVARQAMKVVEAYEAIQPQVWISRFDEAAVLAQAQAVDRKIYQGATLVLAGVPFAVKDNIDVAGLPTTAGCPAFAYRPTETAPIVKRLIDAGAILIGKTNLDQFATGLVGTRSPYGACASVYNRAYISGGSSSGSAVAVAKGEVCFALGTDTAGSGRVPAAFNGIVGIKPTRGLVSTAGVVPACRSLDCVSIFSPDVATGAEVLEILAGVDEADPYSRSGHPQCDPSAPPRIGVPSAQQMQFFGDQA